jgi:outer membrane protein
MKPIRIQATRHRTLALAAGLAIAGGFVAAPLHAQDANPRHFAIVGGFAHGEPTGDATINGATTEFDGSGATTLGLSYYINDNVAIEGWGAASKFDHRMTTTADGKIGTASAQPWAVSGQYHFRQGSDTIRPFVGLGYFQNNISDEDQDDTGPYADQHIGIGTAKGPMATLGVDLNFTPSVFARADARYLHGGADVEIDGVDAGDADLNPVVLEFGVGARF